MVKKNVGIDIVILHHDVNVEVYFWKRQDTRGRREMIWIVEDRSGRRCHGGRRERVGVLKGKKG